MTVDLMDLSAFWRKSVCCVLLAGKIAQAGGIEKSEPFFIEGLLPSRSQPASEAEMLSGIFNRQLQDGAQPRFDALPQRESTHARELFELRNQPKRSNSWHDCTAWDTLDVIIHSLPSTSA